MNDYGSFKRSTLSLTGIDLNCYKEGQMKRRIDTFVRRSGVFTYDDFFRLLKTNRKLHEDFLNYLTINVSEFYRNPEQWEILDQEIVPGLMEGGRDRLKIWSAACATGDEPYSLVMLMSRHVPLSKIKVIATDLDDGILDKARAARYGEKSLEKLPSEFRRDYFHRDSDGYVVKNEIKSRVEFRKHNLLSDEYLKDCDLIVCRNVLIYFTDAAKNEIYHKFHRALRPGGVLFLGSTEQIADYRSFGYGRRRSFFYEKR